MGQIIAVLSGKGGTGKTSFCANVAVALCALGQRTLLVDADDGLRNLDIVLGLEGALLFSYADVLAGNASLREASVSHPQVRNLRVLTAPGRMGIGAVGALPELYDRCRERFAYTFIDCPAGLGEEVFQMAVPADRVVVVSTADNGALRSAQAAGMALRQRGQAEVKIVVNRAKKRLMERGETPGVDAAMDLSGLPLLGVVPEDECVYTCGSRSEVLLLSAISPAVSAYGNIAKRIAGERVPLFHEVKGF